MYVIQGLQPNKLNINYRYYGNGYVRQCIEVNTKTYHKVNDYHILQLFKLTK